MTTKALQDSHPDDVQMLQAFRDRMRQIRRDRGVSGASLSRSLGRSLEAVSHWETSTRKAPLMSTWQTWAGALDLRIEFTLDGWKDLVYFDPRTQSLFEASRPWGADTQMRLWLVAALRTWRVAHGVELATLASLLGMTASGIHQWEMGSTDPYIPRVMWQARHLGTRVMWQLLDQDRSPV